MTRIKRNSWNEIKKCGVVSNILKYEEAKVLKVAKTFPVRKGKFFKFLNELNSNIQNKFSEMLL